MRYQKEYASSPPSKEFFDFRPPIGARIVDLSVYAIVSTNKIF